MTKTTMKIWQVPATLEGISMLKDGGISARFHTNELTSEQKIGASEFYQRFGWLTFSENDDVEVPGTNAPQDEFAKKPSVRLRNALYVLYQQSEQDVTFDEFYRRNIEKFINIVKQNFRD